MALFSRAGSLLRPVTGAIRQEIRIAQRCMSSKGGFEEKEHAIEDMYIKKAEENLLKKLLAKIKEEETAKPKCDKTATKELQKILGTVPEDVAKKLLEWKEKH